MRPVNIAAVLAVTALAGLLAYSSEEPAPRIVETLIGVGADSIIRDGSSYEDGERAALRDLEKGIKQYVIYGLITDGQQVKKHLASYGLEAYFAGCMVSDWGDGYNDTVRQKLGIMEEIQKMFALEAI